MTLCRLRRQSPGDHIAMTVQVFVGECRLKASKAPPPDLLRLSVGLEDPGDLIADLECALAV